MASLADFFDCRRWKLVDKDKLFLKLFCLLLRSNLPREVSKPPDRNVIAIADACHELESRDRACGLGGVLKASSGRKELFFNCPE